MSHALEVSVRKEALRVTLSQGHQIHLLRLYAPAVTSHAQLLVLPGLGNDSSVWLSGEHPWVRTMAQAGWDVYVADTRGKGFSLPKISPQSDWGLHSLLDEEIPALVSHMRDGNAALPWLCVAEDVPGLGFLTALVRQRIDDAQLQGVLLLQVGRLEAGADWRYRWLWRVGQWASRLTGYVRSPWLSGPAAESRPRFFESLAWLSMPDWVDPDGADIGRAAQGARLPDILHIAQQPHWLPAANVQRFVRSLPAHNAQLLHCDAADVAAWRQGDDAVIASRVAQWASDAVHAGLAPIGEGVAT